MPAPFLQFGPSHLTVLMLTPLVVVLMNVLRRYQHPGALWLERLLGTALLLQYPFSLTVNWLGGTLDAQKGLPLHFCDVAGIAGGLALWTRHQLACEIVYFFGLAGTLQGLLTPNLKEDFPDPRYFGFFVLHAGVVIAALHVVTAMKHAPRPGAVPRLVALTLVYAAFVGLINALLGTNFAFLCQKPEQASLLDSLGPWPWYIGVLVILCGIFYTLLDLPFMIQRRRKRG